MYSSTQQLLNVKILSSNTVKVKKQFTTYEIEVRPASTMPWLRYKRFSDFDRFHDELSRLVKVTLPTLPDKRWYNSRSAEVVSKRKAQLQKYLEDLLCIPEVVRTNVFLDFLGVPTNIRDMITGHGRGGANLYRTPVNELDDSIINTGVPEEVIEVNRLLQELALQKNRLRAITHFEHWYFQAEARLTPELIKKLLVGDLATVTSPRAAHNISTVRDPMGGHEMGGLIQACGLVNHPKVAWRSSLRLLVHLLDINRNKDARLFQQIFLTLPRDLFKKMELHRHIADSTQEHGFQICKLIQDHVPLLHHSHYVVNEEAWQQFLKWEKLQKDSLQPCVRPPEETEKERAFNWREHSNHLVIAEIILRNFKDLGKEPPEEYRYLEHMSRYGLTIRYKKEQNCDEWKIGVSFMVNHSAKDVYDFLVQGYVTNSYGQIQGWNLKVVDWKLIKQLDSQHIIYEETYKSFNSPYHFRDVVLLRCLRQYSDTGRYLTVFASISDYDDVLSPNTETSPNPNPNPIPNGSNVSGNGNGNVSSGTATVSTVPLPSSQSVSPSPQHNTTVSPTLSNNKNKGKSKNKNKNKLQSVNKQRHNSGGDNGGNIGNSGGDTAVLRSSSPPIPIKGKSVTFFDDTVGNEQSPAAATTTTTNAAPEIWDKASKETHRTIILPSGFEIEQSRDSPNLCTVDFRAHMTGESFLIVAPDLLGETDELFQSLLQISNLVSVFKQQRL